MAFSAGSLRPGRHIEWTAEDPTALRLWSLPPGHLTAPAHAPCRGARASQSLLVPRNPVGQRSCEARRNRASSKGHNERLIAERLSTSLLGRLGGCGEIRAAGTHGSDQENSRALSATKGPAGSVRVGLMDADTRQNRRGW